MAAPPDDPDDLTEVLAALGDPTRWAILRRVGRQPASASGLAGEFPVSRQAIAKHLGVLESTGLVRSGPRGREVVFSAVGDPLIGIAAKLERIAHGWDTRLAALKESAER